MKKLLVWDGDGTLWRGTILEGDAIHLPPERLALCHELHDRGVLQSIASYNTPEDVSAVVYRFGLDRWFLHWRAGLDTTKSALIAEIAMAYGLARLDDIVFVDDDPLNLAEVAAAHPAITTGLPADIDSLIAQHFTKAHYTDEDRRRVRRYQSDAVRASAAAAYGDDHRAFLRSCQIEVRIAPATPSDTLRVTDLVARANRMSAIAVDTVLDWPRLIAAGEVYVARIADKFGDYGLAALLATAGTDVVALVVSCRLQGRGIGSALLGWWINCTAPQRVSASWQETRYNAGIQMLYEWYGFTIARTAAGRVDVTREGPRVTLPDWLQVHA